MIRRWIIFAMAFGLVAGCGGGSSGPTNPVPPGPGAALRLSSASHVSPETNINELPEPPVVRPVNGVATLALTAEINPATGLPTFAYEGMHAVIPTIDVKPGQSFVVDVTDDLPATGSMASDINLHFHGLGSSPKRPGDDVLGMLALPGQSLHYVVHVPTNQEPGLYWYHPHVHGQTSYQVGEGGMSGALVIEGLDRHIPALSKMKQRIIIVRSTGIGINAQPDTDVDATPREMAEDMGGTSSMGRVHSQHSNTAPCSTKDMLTTTLNGAFRPDITISPGEKQFFRVVNATGHKTLRLNVEGEKVQVVAIDGFALDTYPGTPAEETKAAVIIPPAARAEFIVTGPAGGHARFRTLCYDTGPNGDPDPYILLAHIVAPKHPDAGYYSNRPLAVGAPLPRNVYDTTLPRPAAKRVVVFSENAKPEFFINGKAFSLTAPPMFVVHVGTVEEWHIFNTTQEIHDFHIHQLHFLVQEINGVKVPHPYWADSVIVPHRQDVGNKSVPGSLTALMDFRDPIIKGEFVFHCHILDHEDQGMMAKIQAI